MNKPVNAFMWREYMAEENAKAKKPRVIASALTTAKAIEKRHQKDANFGTIPWLSKRDHMLKPREFLIYSKAGVK